MAEVGQDIGTGSSIGGAIGTAIMPGLGTAIGAGAGALLGAGIGLYQHQHNKKKAAEDEANRPKYEIPVEIQQNLTQAQQQELQGLPEEQKQQFISNLQRSSAYALSQGSSRRAGLAGVASVNQNQNDAYGNMLSQDSAARMENQNKLYGARQTMADYKDQAFQINKENPYYEQIAQRNSNNGALAKTLMNTANLGSYIGGNIQRGATNNPQIQPIGNINNPNQAQYGNYGGAQNSYNYNPNNNINGIVPDGINNGYNTTG